MSSVRRVAAMVDMLGGSVGRAIERLRIPRLAVQGGDFKEPDERLKETESDEQEREWGVYQDGPNDRLNNDSCLTMLLAVFTGKPQEPEPGHGDTSGFKVICGHESRRPGEVRDV